MSLTAYHLLFCIEQMKQAGDSFQFAEWDIWRRDAARIACHIIAGAY